MQVEQTQKDDLEKNSSSIQSLMITMHGNQMGL